MLQGLTSAESYPSSAGRQLLQYGYNNGYYRNRGYNWSGGRIAGVIVGCVCFALAILFAVLACTIRKRRMAKVMGVLMLVFGMFSMCICHADVVAPRLSNCSCYCRPTMLTQLEHTLRRQFKIRLILRLTSTHRLVLTLIKHIHRAQGATTQLHTHRIQKATTQLHTIPVQRTLTQLQALLQMDIMECRCPPCLMKRLVTRVMCRRLQHMP